MNALLLWFFIIISTGRGACDGGSHLKAREVWFTKTSTFGKKPSLVVRRKPMSSKIQFSVSAEYRGGRSLNESWTLNGGIVPRVSMLGFSPGFFSGTPKRAQRGSWSLAGVPSPPRKCLAFGLGGVRTHVPKGSYNGSRGGGSDFVTGFLLGGAIFGTLGYVFAPQIRRSLLNEDEYGFRKAKRPIYYEGGLE
ncbi:hypothetical protein Golob_018581, partial [Gossypium lobatum]|nr:hypothetical protein [Gossypium lobatum]